MPAYLMTSADVAALRQSETELKNKLKSLRRQFQSYDRLKLPDTHEDCDVAEHGETSRDIGNVERQLQEIGHTLQNVVEVEHTAQNERVQIGNNILVQRYADPAGEQPIGKPEWYHVCSHGCTDMKADPPHLAYDSPLIANFYGKTVDPDRDPVRVTAGHSKTFYMDLKEIVLPAKRKQRRQTSLRAVS